MQITICGKRWNLRLVRPHSRRSTHGTCDRPDVPAKTIVVEDADDATTLDTLLHELLHAGLFELREEFVTQWATDAANVLKRLGWRRVKQNTGDGE